MSATSPESGLRSPIAVIGGSGFYSFDGNETSDSASLVSVSTPYSSAAELVLACATPAGDIWFLPRHGTGHSVAPHEINYRSKLWALHKLGARAVVAVNAVGGISSRMTTGTLVLPDQLIDYTWGRAHTFVEGNHRFAAHVDFTFPYDAQMCEVMESAGKQAGLHLVRGGVYACTQGPRLETAAEIRKLAADGCDIVGMTGMPEAALARELGLRYCSVAVVVNKAAGLQSEETSLAGIGRELADGINRVRRLLLQALPGLLDITAP